MLFKPPELSRAVPCSGMSITSTVLLDNRQESIEFNISQPSLTATLITKPFKGVRFGGVDYQLKDGILLSKRCRLSDQGIPTQEE